MEYTLVELSLVDMLSSYHDSLCVDLYFFFQVEFNKYDNYPIYFTCRYKYLFIHVCLSLGLPHKWQAIYVCMLMYDKYVPTIDHKLPVDEQ